MTDHYRIARREFESPGGPFATREVIVRGTPVREFVSAPPHMRAVWEAATAHGDKPYVVYEDERFTYTDTDDPYFYRRGPSGSREHYDADDRRAFDSSANQEPEGSWEQDPAGS